ncbi:MAG: DUF983 domain-containing protein [Rhodomicrobium sp.]
MQHSSGSEPASSHVWTNAYAPADRRPVLKSILRGASLKCPKCGRGRLFSSYLAVSRTCAGCGEELFHHRADDAPPYFTIFIVGHIIVSLVITTELLYGPPLWLHFAIWLPLTVLLSLALLPVVKGAIVGLQWALKMHGFEDAASPGHALKPSGLQWESDSGAM